eukprot:7390173-Prymnesium_polylepis.2
MGAHLTSCVHCMLDCALAMRSMQGWLFDSESTRHSARQKWHEARAQARFGSISIPRLEITQHCKSLHDHVLVALVLHALQERFDRSELLRYTFCRLQFAASRDAAVHAPDGRALHVRASLRVKDGHAGHWTRADTRMKELLHKAVIGRIRLEWSSKRRHHLGREMRSDKPASGDGHLIHKVVDCAMDREPDAMRPRCWQRTHSRERFHEMEFPTNSGGYLPAQRTLPVIKKPSGRGCPFR